MRKIVERWDSDAFKNKKIARTIFFDVKKRLKVMPHPFHGWRSVPNQKFQTISINEYGLRNKSFKDLAKNKKNCILLGGSVAWGFGVSSNDYIPSSLIEKILSEKYNINLNVINFAEQMHSSFEEMLTFVSVVDEIKPSLVISLSLNNDINRAFANIYKITDLNLRQLNFFLKGQKYGLIDEKYLSRSIFKMLIRNFKANTKVNENNFTFYKPDRSTISENLFNNKLMVLNEYCEKNKIKLFHFLQPDLIYKKNKTKSEENYFNWLGNERIKFIENNFEIIKRKFFEKENYSDNIFFFNLANIFNNVEGTVFFDRVHFFDKGNKILAEEISLRIAKKLNKF